jgi:hypothetical protein
MASRVTPLAILLSSAAYFYNSANNVANLASIATPRSNSNATLAYTNEGILRGTRAISRIGRSYYQFRGVPFATAPLGDLRFEVDIVFEASLHI